MSATSAVSAVSDGFVVAKRNLIKIKRVPDLLVFTTSQPLMFVPLFPSVFGAAIVAKGTKYEKILVARPFAHRAVCASASGAAKDPAAKRREKTQCMKNRGLRGGVRLAAVDTAGKPGLAYRTRYAQGQARRQAALTKREARRAARRAKHFAKHALD